MEMPFCIHILAEQDIVTARQMGRKLAKDLGYGTIFQSRIATAISELARNIYLYADSGTIKINIIEKEGRVGLSIIAEDKGVGIRDLKTAMEDGYSTSGGLGAGLPGVKRLMDEFSIESTVGIGTRVEVVKWRD
ncbi:MAG: anti-sigma regulatory factor [Clostridia bacterium]